MNIFNFNIFKKFTADATEPFSDDAFQQELLRLHDLRRTEEETYEGLLFSHTYVLQHPDFKIRAKYTSLHSGKYSLKIQRKNNDYMTCLPTPYYTTDEIAKLAYETIQWKRKDLPPHEIKQIIRQNNWPVQYCGRDYNHIAYNVSNYERNIIRAYKIDLPGLYINAYREPQCTGDYFYNARITASLKFAPLPLDVRLTRWRAKSIYNCLEDMYNRQQQKNQGR